MTMMDDRIRASEADRERVTARLREHFAEGRLTADELDERITAALSAKTLGDLRAIMTDLPEPAAVPQAGPPGPPQRAAYRGPARRRGPRLLPLALVALAVALVLPGAGWLLFAFVKVMLVLWLVACLAGIFAAARLRRHLRRGQRDFSGPWPSGRWHQHGWPHQHWDQYSGRY